MLQAQPFIKDWMVKVRHVTCSEDAREGRLAVFIDDDTVLDGETGGLSELRLRLHPHPDDDNVARDTAARRAYHSLDPSGAFKALDRLISEELHALVTVELAIQPPHLLSQCAFERHPRHLQNTHLQPHAVRRCGYLRTDETSTDHHQAPARL